MKRAEQFAKTAVTPKTGRFTTLRALLLVQGSGASAPSLVAVPLLALCVLLALCLNTLAAPASASEGCENEARRVEQNSTFLPDCRAYELVSLPDMPPPGYQRYSEGVAPISPTSFAEPNELHAVESTLSAAVGGDAVLYQGSEANSQGAGERNNLSRRGPNGWTGENIEPPQARRGFLCGVTGYVGFSENFEEVAWIDGRTESENGEPDSIEDCGHDEPPLAPGEPKESGNLFLRNTATGSYQLVNVTPAGIESYQPQFDAITADGSHVVFNSRAHLTSDAPPVPGLAPGDLGCGPNPHVDSNEFGDVYVWSAGTVHLLTVLPDGTALRGTLAGVHATDCGIIPVQSAEVTHAISKDGERILFYAGGGFENHGESGEYNPRPDAPYIDGGLYLREHPGAEQSALNGSGDCTEPQKACTIQVDLPETGASGSPGDGQFQWANTETTEIFFTDTDKLTPDSTAAPEKPDLYEYDLEKPEGERLSDLTASASEPADMLGVSGASEDGSYLYFAAQGDLTGAQQNSHGDTALAPAQGSGTLSGAAKLVEHYRRLEPGDGSQPHERCISRRSGNSRNHERHRGGDDDLRLHSELRGTDRSDSFQEHSQNRKCGTYRRRFHADHRRECQLGKLSPRHGRQRRRDPAWYVDHTSRRRHSHALSRGDRG